MYKILEKRLQQLLTTRHHKTLKGNQIGLEKESLRVSKEGGIASTPHPAQFGSALTNPFITTDYSEALIEFITPASSDLRNGLQFLYDAQKFVYEHLKSEQLWATSMPCIVGDDSSIPVAQYGDSNVGKMKTV